MPGQFETPITIKDVVSRIDRNELLLPAIQRKFVWTHQQVSSLFDSIMRGYPINTFMFWEVSSERNRKEMKYYRFLDKYIERFHEDNEDLNVAGIQSFNAVVDGQQRLNSIYLGLKGSYAYKLPRLWWPVAPDEKIIPTRRLYLNLKKQCEESNEEKMYYDFRFLTSDEYKSQDAEENQCWFLLEDILSLFNGVDASRELMIINNYLRDKGLMDCEFANMAITRLFQVIHKEKTITYFLEKDPNIDHVLDIFIRTNKGGTELTYSDLLMSLAVAAWSGDARGKIDGLVERIRDYPDMGFSIDKDLILRSCLVLTEGNIKFRVANFTNERVQLIESLWEDIEDCLVETFKLVRSFGLNDSSLRAKNAVIPIVYYLFWKDRNTEQNYPGLFSEINKPNRHSQERAIIRKWLHLSLLNGVFSGQTDELLTTLRGVIKENLGSGNFPLDAIVKRYKGTRRALDMDDDFIEKLLQTRKGDRQCFSILSLLFPDIDFTRSLNIDHLHPESFFKKERLQSFDFLKNDPNLMDFFADSENWDTVPNLHLLDESLNKSKSNEPLSEWMDRPEICLKPHNLGIPAGTSLAFKDFPDFVSKRKSALKAKLKNLI